MAEEKKEENKELSKKEKKALKKQQKAEAKAKKKEEKEKKKAAKKNGEAVPESNEDDDEGGGIIVALVTIIILAIWLLIFGILIKMDVGGFGSTVLYPIFKNVPVINKILPETENSGNSKKGGSYNYSSVSDAVKRIKSLERELSETKKELKQREYDVSDLKSKTRELKSYKENQSKFEAAKKKFDKEVVFSDKAPDINKYKEYYESISPENAEAIYKEVIGQQEETKEVQEYAKTYAAMKPSEAASIFNTMTSNLKLVARILNAMDSESRGKILGAMKADIAAQVTQIMEP